VRAGILLVDGIAQNGNIYTVATLPAAASTPVGTREIISDATGPTFLGILTGGGTVVCSVAWAAGGIAGRLADRLLDLA